MPCFCYTRHPTTGMRAQSVAPRQTCMNVTCHHLFLQAYTLRYLHLKAYGEPCKVLSEGFSKGPASMLKLHNQPCVRGAGCTHLQATQLVKHRDCTKTSRWFAGTTAPSAANLAQIQAGAISLHASNSAIRAVLEGSQFTTRQVCT